MISLVKVQIIEKRNIRNYDGDISFFHFKTQAHTHVRSVIILAIERPTLQEEDFPFRNDTHRHIGLHKKANLEGGRANLQEEEDTPRRKASVSFSEVSQLG